jgi:plastocyanin
MTMMQALSVVICGMLLIGSAQREPRPRTATGTIRGRVDVRTTGTTELRPDIAALGMHAAHDRPDRRRSVVYLETAPRAAFDPNEEPRASMDQRNENFVPHVLPIIAGTTVDFPNDDSTYHSVFSLSKPKPFNLGRYAAGRSKSVRFDQPGIVRVFCDIHSHMSAFILVFAHRYFTVTDDDGRYRLPNVPAGAYTLTVWNETVRGDAPRRAIAIAPEGGDIDADFTIR